MKRIYFGVFLLLFAFLLIALFVHNLDYWVAVKWWSLNTVTIGSLCIFFPVMEKFKTTYIYQILFTPKKWYISVLSLLAFILSLTILYMVIEKTAISTNKAIQAYYLKGKVQGTRARVVGIVNFRFTLKSTYHQPFMAIEYITPDGVLRQGLDIKQFAHLKNGQLIDIVYSRDHPSIFKVE